MSNIFSDRSKIIIIFLLSLSVIGVVMYILTGRKGTSEEWDCWIDSGDPNFRLRMLCDKKIYVMYMSGNVGNYSCVVGRFTCFRDGTVNCDSIVFQHGEKFAQSSLLVDLGNGVIQRESKAPEGDSMYVRDIVASFKVFPNGDVIVGYYICGNPAGDNHPIMRAIITTQKDADLTDDVNVMKKLFPGGGLHYVPNKCDVNDYY